MKYRNDRYLTGAVTTLAVSLTALPVFAADDNPFQTREVERNSSVQKQPVQGMCGGSWEGRCGGMMGGMPLGVGPAELPDPNSAGAKLATQYCIQCHGLPSPTQHSASGWSPTVARMNMRMQWMSRNNSPMNIKAPTEDELRTLTAYLEKHAADPEATTAPDGRQEPVPDGKTALEILRERYARGEIDRKEYMQMLEDLDGR